MNKNTPIINPSVAGLALVAALAAVTVGHYATMPDTTYPTKILDVEQLPNIYDVKIVNIIDDSTGEAHIIMNGFLIKLSFDYEIQANDIDITSITVLDITAANTGHPFNDFTTYSEKAELAAQVKSFLLKSKSVGE